MRRGPPSALNFKGHISNKALLIIQEVAENFLTCVLRDAADCADHVDRETVMIRDLELALRLQHKDVYYAPSVALHQLEAALPCIDLDDEESDDEEYVPEYLDDEEYANGESEDLDAPEYA